MVTSDITSYVLGKQSVQLLLLTQPRKAYPPYFWTDDVVTVFVDLPTLYPSHGGIPWYNQKWT